MILKKKFLVGVGLALTLSACAPTIEQRGNMLDSYQLQQVTAGTSTRSDVLRVLGSPTTTAPFDENTWYYLGQETEKHGILDPKVTKEKIIVVSFNDDGIVQNLSNVPPHRIDVPIDTAKTATHGNDLTITQQLLGNLGKFNSAPDKGGAINTAGGNR